MCCSFNHSTYFFFHVPFWLIVRLENVSFDDYLLALEIESSFQRRRLLECKILDSLSLETEEVGRCMSMMLGNPCDFIRNLWLLSGLLTPKINQSTLNFRKAATTAQFAPRSVIGKSLANFASFEGLPFFSNAQLKLMSCNIRKRNMDFHMTSWAIEKMAFEVISQVFLGVIKFSKKRFVCNGFASYLDFRIQSSLFQGACLRC